LSEDQRLNLPFTGIASFAKYPVWEDLDALEADVAILGFPCDMATQWRSGQRFGPRGMREESSFYGLGQGGAYDFERDIVFLGPEWKVFDVGDVDIVHGDLARSFENGREAVRKIAGRGAMPVVLGGDHSITIPVVEALADRGPFAVVQIDAHLDFVDERHGQRYGHGSPMRRISEMDHVSGMAQIGVRGLGSSKKEDFDTARERGSVIVGAREAKANGMEEVLGRIPDADRYYVTIDIDALDPALCPGSGGPSPGGFSYEEVVDLLEGLAPKGEIVGFDLVEVNPPYDPSGLTAQVGARLVLDFMGFILHEASERARLEVTRDGRSAVSD
jgi:agmatinase